MNTPKRVQLNPKHKKHINPQLKRFILFFFLSAVFLIITGFTAIKILSRDLPRLDVLENIYNEQNLSTVIYSQNGDFLRNIARDKRVWVPGDSVPRCMIDALIANEDQRFNKHWGVSIPDIMRALKEDIIHLSIKQGGSTITQQLAKQLYFSPEKSVSRKIKEILTAIQIEKNYSKSEILEMYLNKVEFNGNTYGIQMAAKYYFNKNASELTVPEAALMVGVINNPNLYNPKSTIEKKRIAALNRRNVVLRRMAETGKIPWSVADEESSKPIVLAENNGPSLGLAYHYVRNVSDELYNRYGKEYVETKGLKVYTTLDSRLQKIAEDSLKAQLDWIQKNYADKLKYTRPPGLSDTEAEKDFRSKKVVQGALVAIDVRTGAILAMVGGYGKDIDFFNRATQALRQPGSSFKPFVYTAALDNGWRCSDTVLDSPFSMHDGSGKLWSPKNFDGTYRGIITLRDAMKYSDNIATIKLMMDPNRGIGPKNVVKYANKMGITTELYASPALALGTGQVRLIDMVSAYTVFPNLGIRTEPFYIGTIYDKNGSLVYGQPNGEGKKTEVLDSGVASLMVTMLKTVCVEGTAATQISRRGMKDRPAGGKTGTGNDFKDAWFIGFTPYIACGVWIGFDSEESTLGGSLYGTGSAAALPAWVGFTKAASEDLGLPKDDFKFSPNITSARLCKQSHLRATPNCTSTYAEYYIRGTGISEFCNLHDSWRINTGSQQPGVSKKRGF